MIQSRWAAIRRIHESDALMIIAELGTGGSIFNSLWQVPGASKTLFAGVTPYSREITKHFPRAVSKEVAEAILMDNEIESEFENENVNTFVVTTFTIGKDQLDHGWIMIKYKEKVVLCHMTMKKSEHWTRQNTSETLAHTCINILYDLIFNTDLTPEYYIDMDYLDYNGKQRFDILLSILGNKILAFENEKLIRVEELFRRGENWAIIRGSFDPLHIVHLNIAQDACELIGHVAFMISTYNFDERKSVFNAQKLLERIYSINHHGYPVLIVQNKYFLPTQVNLLERLKYNRGEIKLHWAVGDDVRARIDDADAKNLSLLITGRTSNDVSSTKIRNKELCRCGKQIRECVGEDSCEIWKDDPSVKKITIDEISS